MKISLSTTILSCLVLGSTIPLAAQQADDPANAYLEQFLPYCAEPPKVEEGDFPGPVPSGMEADVIILRSENPTCGGMYLEVVSEDRIYVGQPWILSEYEGSIDRKVSRFAWDRLEESASATVSDETTPEGLLEATVEMTTEWGKVRLPGAVDAEGNFFFPGGFEPIRQGARESRLQVVRPILDVAPRKGDENSAVTLIEFSDFQCPSCSWAAEWVSELLADYGDRISYHRIDYPLTSAHPWAFPAALYGRAIWEQSPDAFWRYKNEVYQNQSSLTAFTIESFARDFVEANELDLSSFDTAVSSRELKDQILDGIAAGMIAEVKGTPTFWVNGQPVAAGHDGAFLRTVLDAALEQTAGR
ncbi:MAG: thioredoxin domain-containing protein [Thermoanaerobaculia bacterium]|nr:thioredoxin domain-containing protein [Thermoanaerobaculia bacterium]